MNALLVLPVLIPLGTAAVSLLAWRRVRAQGWLSIGGSAALLAAAIALLVAVRRGGILAVQIGQWPAPFGITFVADLFAALMVVLAGIVGLAVTVYSVPSVDRARKAHGYHPLVSLLLAGVCGAFLTGDVFNLFVWFEVMLISSFVLLALGGERPQLEGAIKYVTLNLVSSALFLAAVGLLYGLAGTLNMADLAVKLADTRHPGLVTTSALLFLAAFGIKAGMFPLFFWLPAAYHTPPAAVSALFSGLLTKVGVYALVRMFTLVFTQDVGYTHALLLAAAGLTMITGVLGAVTQGDFRRVLSFHIVSQIGYMVMGLALFVPLAVAGAVFYIAHHIIVKTNLFLVSGVAHRLRGTYDLVALGGLYGERPLLAGLFLVSALSLAGVPPLSGFFAKLVLVRASLEVESYAIAIVALVVGLLTLFSMTKIWAEAFWKAAPPPAEGRDAWAGDASPRALALMLAPVAALAALTVAIGLAPGPVLAFSMDAAAQLLDPSEYVRTVLGAAR
jgi:multicomponent Na+:H+ antiporter subunit D